MACAPAKSQISLGIRAVRLESSLCAQWVAKDPSFLMRTAKTLIRLGGCPGWSESSLGTQSIFVGFVMRWFKCFSNTFKCVPWDPMVMHMLIYLYTYSFSTFSFNTVTNSANPSFVKHDKRHTRSFWSLTFITLNRKSLRSLSFKMSILFNTTIVFSILNSLISAESFDRGKELPRSSSSLAISSSLCLQNLVCLVSELLQQLLCLHLPVIWFLMISVFILNVRDSKELDIQFLRPCSVIRLSSTEDESSIRIFRSALWHLKKNTKWQ